jgi:hypothetical protein
MEERANQERGSTRQTKKGKKLAGELPAQNATKAIVREIPKQLING